MSGRENYIERLQDELEEAEAQLREERGLRRIDDLERLAFVFLGVLIGFAVSSILVTTGNL